MGVTEDAIAAWSTLPAAPAPVGLYAPFVRIGDLVALSAISSARDGVLVTGKVGRDLDLDAGRAAARRAAENLLAVLIEAADGDPARIDRILIVRGYVNATEDFAQVHKVVDAASERLIETLGETRGAHARTALGCATLPNGNAVTLEALAQLSRPTPAARARGTPERAGTRSRRRSSPGAAEPRRRDPPRAIAG